MHFEIYSQFEGLAGIASLASGVKQWRWRLIADNGKKIASGEGYYNKADCLHAVELLKATYVTTPVYEVAD